MRLLNISLKFFGNYDFFSFNILLNKLQPLKLFSSKLLLKGMRWKKLRGNILAKTPDWAIFYRDFGRTVSKSPMPANRWRPHPAKIVFKSGWRNEFQSNYLTFRRFLFSSFSPALNLTRSGDICSPRGAGVWTKMMPVFLANAVGWVSKSNISTSSSF